MPRGSMQAGDRKNSLNMSTTTNRRCRDSSMARFPTSASAWILSAFALSSFVVTVRAARGSQASALNVPHQGANSRSSPIRELIRARCGSSFDLDEDSAADSAAQRPYSMWSYHGSLYDPLEGKRVAYVQGLEIVQHVASCDGPQSESTSSFVDKCRNLIAASLVTQHRASFDHASTFLSRKLFCYTTAPPEHDLGSEHDLQKVLQGIESDASMAQVNADGDKPARRRNNLLRSIRVRHNSPLRKIPRDQSIALYDTAVTMIQRNGNELVLHTESPNQGSIWGTTVFRSSTGDAQSSRDNASDAYREGGSGATVVSTTSNTETVEFSIYARRRSRKVAPRAQQQSYDHEEQTIVQPQTQQPDLTAPPMRRNLDGSFAPVVSPNRIALIQFGGTSMEEQKNKFGARETYSYTLNYGDASNQPAGSSSSRQRGAWRSWMRLPLFGRTDASSAGPAPVSDCTVKYTRYGEGPPFYAPNRMCTLELEGRRIRSLDEAGGTIAQIVRRQVPSIMALTSTATALSQSRRLQVLPDPNDDPKTWREKRLEDLERVYQQVKRATKLTARSDRGWSR